jgi:radical SAM protein (TIGR01212 family)
VYRRLSEYLRETFGCRVFKVCIDAGFTCPNRDGAKGFGGCAYCLAGAHSPRSAMPGASVAAQMAAGMERVRARRGDARFIAYFQSNTNTYGPAGRLEALYAEALGKPGVAGVAVSTRPDCLGPDVLDVLERLGGKTRLWVELGLQSSNNVTLERLNRRHTAEEFADAVERLRGRGIDVCAHVILGLPGETGDDALATMGFLSRLRVWGVKFHHLQVLRGTPIEKGYAEGSFGVLGLEEYARLVVRCLEALPRDTVIHRLSSDAPEDALIAPRWGVDRFALLRRVSALMVEGRALEGPIGVEGR